MLYQFFPCVANHTLYDNIFRYLKQHIVFFHGAQMPAVICVCRVWHGLENHILQIVARTSPHNKLKHH